MPNEQDAPAYQYTNLDSNNNPKPVSPTTGVQINATPDSSVKPFMEDDTEVPSIQDYMNKYVTVLSEHYKQNDQVLSEELKYGDVVFGKATYEEVRDSLNQQTIMRERGIKNVNAMVSDDDWVKYVYPLVDSLPYMREVMRATAMGNLAGAGVGAGAGTLVGGPVGTGVGGALGFTFGGPATAFMFASKQGAGKAYKNFREQGIPHEAAKRYALAYGAVHGVIEGAQSALITKGFTSGFTSVLKHPSSRKLIESAVGRFIGASAIEGLEEGTDELSSIIIDELAGSEYHIQNLRIENSNWLNRVAQATVVGGVMGGTLHGVAHVGGKITGKLADNLTKNRKGMLAETVQDVLKAYKEAAHAEANPDLKPELATSLKQALEQAEKNSSNVKQGSVSVNVTSDAPTVETSSMKANNELADAKQELAKAREEKKALKEQIAALGTADIPEDLQTKLEAAIEAENEAIDNLDAAKLNVVKYQLNDTVNDASLSDMARMKAMEQVDELTKKVRDIRKRNAARRAQRAIDETTELMAKTERSIRNLEKKRAKELAAINKDLKDKKISSKKAKEQREDLNKVMDSRKTNLVGRLAKQQSRLDTNKTLLEAINSNMLNNSEVNKLRDKLGNADTTEIVNTAIQLILKTSREVAWSTAAGIKKNQTILRKLIKESGLSKADREQFLSQINSIQSENDLKRIAYGYEVKNKKTGAITKVTGMVEKMDTLLEKRNKEEALTKLEGLAEANSFKPTGSKLDRADNSQEIFSWVNHFVNPVRKKSETVNAAGIVETHTESLQDARARVYAKAQQDYADELVNVNVGSEADVTSVGINSDVEFAYEVSNLVGDLNNSTSAEINSVVDTLSGKANASKLRRLEQIQKEMQFIDSVRNAIVMANAPKGTNLNELLTPNGPLKNPDRDKIAARMSRALKSLGKSSFSWEGKLDIIMQKLTPEQRAFVKDALNADRVDSKKSGLARHYNDRLMDTVNKVTGLSAKEFMKHTIDASKKKIEFSYYNQNNRYVTDKLTVAVAQKLLLQMGDSDPYLRTALENNGYTFDGHVSEKHGLLAFDNTAQGALTRALRDSAPNELNLKIVDAVAQHYANVFQDAAKEYKEATGYKLEAIKGYSGNVRHAGTVFSGTSKEMQADLKRRVNDWQTRSGKPTFVNLRTKATTPIDTPNIYTDLAQYNAQLAHWRAWRQPSNVMSNVLADPKVSAIIKYEYGDGMYRALTYHLQDMAVGSIHRQTNWLTKGIDKFLAKMGPLVLLGKLQQYPKQLTGVVSALIELDPHYLATGVTQFNLELAQTIATGGLKPSPIMMKMVNSEQFQNRYNNDYQTWMGTIYSDGNVKFARGENWYNELAGSGLVGGDMHVSLAIAWAKYMQEMDHGATEAQAMERAWMMVERTQASGKISQLSNIARDPALKMFTIFRQQPTRAAEYRLTALRDMVNHMSFKSVSNFLKTELATRLAQGLFVLIDALLIEAFNSGDKDKKEAAWRTVMREVINGPVGILGDVVGAIEIWATAQITGEKDTIRLPQHPTVQSLEYTFKFADQLAKANGNFDEKNSLILAGLFSKGFYRFLVASGALPAIPIEPPITYLKALLGIKGESIESGSKTGINW